jgi:hypothetical protein
MFKSFLALCSLCSVIVMFGSCKKSGGATQSHQITYKIIADNYKLFSDIIYTSEADTLIHASSIDSTGWLKYVNTTKVPFHAKIAAAVINNTGTSCNYTLEIFIDGERKSQATKTSEANSVSDASVEFIIQ